MDFQHLQHCSDHGRPQALPRTCGCCLVATIVSAAAVGADASGVVDIFVRNGKFSKCQLKYQVCLSLSVQRKARTGSKYTHPHRRMLFFSPLALSFSVAHLGLLLFKSRVTLKSSKNFVHTT
jgi:hypothetical protein